MTGTRGTPEKAWRDRFLRALSDSANVRDACRLAKVGRSTVYRERDSDEAFAAAWDEALEDGCDLLELEARRRAVDGTDRPVFYMGNVVGHVTEYSDTLLIFLLKAHRPKKFRENVRVEHDGLPGAIEVKLAFDPGPGSPE